MDLPFILLFEVYNFALIPICGESFSATTEFNLLYGIFKSEIQKVQIVLTQRVGDNGCLLGKPQVGKNHGSPQTPNCPLCDDNYNEGVGGNDLEFCT